ncbi:hypothetical protein HO133_001706 [Letharia lupina]|uniref:Uncharacterized protein n=1 Tax=Letharia lupina TaxID=560253 RepID=A0A8H6CE59_9LECA|nr:uncharacterized protein HO133_001706 [Letharia lupina]KAF6221738.1 hypothetical protein HO133_001706 [Letharia lupina]
MLISRPIVAQCLGLRWELRALSHSRLLHTFGKGAGSFIRFRPSKPPPSQKPSLLEELFPEDVQRGGNRDPRLHDDLQNVPRLPLPEVDDAIGGIGHESDSERAQPKRVAKAAAAKVFRHQQIAVLWLDTGSKSLIESDFRRIAPKGQHIDDWTGPGDILKIIPVRDPTTLESAGRYFILFPNPAYARTYQNHVIRLHRIAKTHTPTSVESPLPLQPGVVIEGEDAYTLLQDYSLCPPSQRIQLRLLFPSYSARIKQVLDQRGYRPLLGETNKTGRSVLFSVDGQQLPTSVIRNTVAADGRDRGLAWDISIDRLDTSRSAADGFEGSTSTETDEYAELGARRHTPARWVMSFPNENEARRFIRAWHRRPFPLARADDPALVQAEFIW